MRNKLGYSYLKISYINNILKSDQDNILCLGFIKIIIRLIKFVFEIIFVDESKIESVNSHLKCRRKKHETIYFSNIKKQKLKIKFID